jgi:hypothetical protein
MLNTLLERLVSDDVRAAARVMDRSRNKSYDLTFFSFRIRNFVIPIVESARTPVRITPYPTGRLFCGALSQALRARLRSHRPFG